MILLPCRLLFHCHVLSPFKCNYFCIICIIKAAIALAPCVTRTNLTFPIERFERIRAVAAKLFSSMVYVEYEPRYEICLLVLAKFLLNARLSIARTNRISCRLINKHLLCVYKYRPRWKGNTLICSVSVFFLVSTDVWTNRVILPYQKLSILVSPLIRYHWLITHVTQYSARTMRAFANLSLILWDLLRYQLIIPHAIVRLPIYRCLPLFPSCYRLSWSTASGSLSMLRSGLFASLDRCEKLILTTSGHRDWDSNPGFCCCMLRVLQLS